VLLRYGTLIDGTGGFLPGVPLGCCCLGIGARITSETPALLAG